MKIFNKLIRHLAQTQEFTQENGGRQKSTQENRLIENIYVFSKGDSRKESSLQDFIKDADKKLMLGGQIVSYFSTYKGLIPVEGYGNIGIGEWDNHRNIFIASREYVEYKANIGNRPNQYSLYHLIVCFKMIGIIKEEPIITKNKTEKRTNFKVKRKFWDFHILKAIKKSIKHLISKRKSVKSINNPAAKHRIAQESRLIKDFYIFAEGNSRKEDFLQGFIKSADEKLNFCGRLVSHVSCRHILIPVIGYGNIGIGEWENYRRLFTKSEFVEYSETVKGSIYHLIVCFAELHRAELHRYKPEKRIPSQGIWKIDNAYIFAYGSDRKESFLGPFIKAADEDMGLNGQLESLFSAKGESIPVKGYGVKTLGEWDKYKFREKFIRSREFLEYKAELGGSLYHLILCFSGLFPSLSIQHQFEFKSIIGSGGFGKVYAAYDRNRAHYVAIKSLESVHTLNAEMRKRFENEALILMGLNHPNIIKIYDLLEHRYLIMEYVGGGSLRAVLKHSHRLTFNEAISITIKILLALQSAHDQDVIHRDVKPENILMVKRDEPKLCDFGIAHLPGAMKNVTTAKSLPEISNSFNVLSKEQITYMTHVFHHPGTLAYMSPEQILGEKLDGRSDIFSTGAVLWEMISGKPHIDPSIYTTPGSMARAILNQNENTRTHARQCGGAKKDLNRIVNKMLNRDRNKRYKTANEAIEDLEREQRFFNK